MHRGLIAVARQTTRAWGSLSAPARLFSDKKLSIPVDIDHQGGRRKEELEAELRGETRFNRDPIVPPADAGTETNPILVPSSEEMRAVGFEDPETHQLVWFRLYKNKLTFVPSISLFFKMQVIESSGGHH